MTWQGFIEKGAQKARLLSGDPKLKIFINEIEIDPNLINFELVEDDNHSYEMILLFRSHRLSVRT